MYGVYGYENEDTGCLAGLGFIGYDVACVSKFFPFYSWTSPIKGTAFSDDGYKALRREQSDDYDDVSGGLIALTVIVWLAVVVLAVVTTMLMMKRMKSGAVSNY